MPDQGPYSWLNEAGKETVRKIEAEKAASKAQSSKPEKPKRKRKRGGRGKKGPQAKAAQPKPQQASQPKVKTPKPGAAEAFKKKAEQGRAQRTARQATRARQAGRRGAVDYLRKQAPRAGKLAQKAVQAAPKVGAGAKTLGALATGARILGVGARGGLYGVGATAVGWTGLEAKRAGQELGRLEKTARHVEKKAGVKVTRGKNWLIRAATGMGPGLKIKKVGKGTYKPATAPPGLRRR